MKLPDISFIGTYRTNQIISIDSDAKIKSINNMQKDLISKKNISKLYNDSLQTIYMEKGINSLGNINVIEGRNFTNDDFKSSINSPIPVLVGYKLIKYNVFKLGEEIEDKQNNRLYKVIGILSNDSTWFRFSPEQGEFMSLDDKLIIPFNDSMYSKILS
jgi:hypothetical protein